METLVGQSVDRYQIQCLLGEGGMGEVYKAHDPRLARDVAIKLMHSFYASRSEFQERFLQEARTAAHLDHPGIVKVLDSGEANGMLFIVMEYIPGDNLRVMLKQMKNAGQEMLIEEAAHLVRQVCLAVDYAHRLGVLYRDIKPDNIMIKNEPYAGLPYRPVLTDLGLAKLLEGIPITREGDALGTPAYMSPEQALGQATDVRSDVYSLGILLYELTVGRLPFEIKTLTEAIRCHTKEAPPSPRFLRPDLPITLEGVMLKALQKDPARRYPDARSMAAEINEAVPENTLQQVPKADTQQGAVSLLTQYKPALAETLGPVFAQQFPPSPSDLAYDRIQILSTDRTIRTMLVKSNILLVGRDADNDIQLDDQSISRHHARIEFDGTQYRIIDLKSTNGVFQEGAKLLPGIPEIWSIGKTVRIGDHWLKLDRTARPYQRVQAEKIDAPGVTTQVQSVLGPERMVILVEEPNIKVDPGVGGVAHITLYNQGQVFENFRVSVLGIPAGWLLTPFSAVQLKPGEQQRLEVLICPPRTPDSRSGAYPLTVQILSQDVPGQPAEAHATLHVSPFYEFQAELEPAGASGRGQAVYRITLHNRSNADVNFQLTASDPEAGCLFFFDPEKVVVSAGKEQNVSLKVKAKTAPLSGASRTSAFIVQIIPAEASQAVRQLEGTFNQVVPPDAGKVISNAPLPGEAAKVVLPRQGNISIPSRPIFPPAETPAVRSAQHSTETRAIPRYIIGWMVMLAAWLAAPAVALQIIREGLCLGCIMSWLFRNIALDERIIGAFPPAMYFIIIGALIGLGTGIALRVVEATFSFGKVVRVTFGWVFTRLVPIFQFVLLPISPWNRFSQFLVGLVEGAIGGVIICLVLSSKKMSLAPSQVVSICLAWVLALGLHNALGGFAEMQLQPPDILTRTIPVFIGGSWTMFQLYRSHQKTIKP
jgi:serine/threonine protein kinase